MTSRTADVEEKFALGDVTVYGQDLPVQTVRAAAEASRLRHQHVRRALIGDRQGGNPAVWERQFETRASAVNSKVEAERQVDIRAGDGGVGRRRRLDQHRVRSYRTIETDEKRYCECQR